MKRLSLRHTATFFSRPAFAALFPALLALALSACTPPAEGVNKPDLPLPPTPRIKGEEHLPRAGAAYIQFMERQSLLQQTPELAAIVSGSSLPWNAPSANSEFSSLLSQAPTWFDFNPLYASSQGRQPVLDQLASGSFPDQLAKIGFKGIFMAPLAESGLSWNADTDMSQQGMDLVGFSVAPGLGGDEAYARLEQKAESMGLMLGGALLPAATGLGPDFALALRGVREYPGLYMMVEIPQELWEDMPLPRLNDKMEGQPLRNSHIKVLAEAGVLPPSFSRDVDSTVSPGGWAISSEVVGVDGVSRRWAYRYAESPLRPVLNWDDPSGSARRVLSASIIQQVGLYHQPLAGISIEALWGQDPAGKTLKKFSPEPAASALRDLSRETRRYGAWTLLRDPFPTFLLGYLQGTEVDFVYDSVTSPHLEYAMMTGDSAPLKKAIDESLRDRVNHARLWRSTSDGNGVNFRLGGLSGEEALNKMFAAGHVRQSWVSLLPVRRNVLYATAPTLAAAVSGLSPDSALNPSPEECEQIVQAHLLQVAFRALQPGLLLLSGQNLSGSMFATGNPYPSHVGWSMDGSLQHASRQGIPSSMQAYPSLAAQLQNQNSFATRLQQVLKVREDSGIANGNLVARVDMSGRSSVGVLSRLPNGDYLLCAGNFSNKNIVSEVRLPQGYLRAGGQGLDLISGHNVRVDGNYLQLRMQPWDFRAVYLPGA